MTPTAPISAPDRTGQDQALVLPLSALDRHSLGVAGGKAANLGELIRAGFPVSPGCCVTTDAYARVAAGAGLDEILEALATTAAGDTAGLEALAGAARERLLAAPVPQVIADAVAQAYLALGGGEPAPVAVRSSATAEDLPAASFAGQQDTLLQVVGVDAVLDAVRRCWASLWTARAVAYRASNGIDHRTVQLAVVVQQMVPAAVAGVLFTANPLTGKRRQAVIDASPGLGEAVVSGAVTPDHFVVDTPTGEIVERRLGDKRLRIVGLPGGGTARVAVVAELEGAAKPCLTDAQIRELARLGARVEAHFSAFSPLGSHHPGAPQDIEWALDTAGTFWLLQARPITTLFPLPANAPASDRDLRVYFSFNVAQGVYRPITPMGLQAFRLMGSAFAALAGWPVLNPFTGPTILVEAGHRLFIDITPLLRHPIGRRAVLRAFQNMEARSAEAVGALLADSRLQPPARGPWRTVRPLLAVLSVLLRTRILPRVLWALLRPAAARARAHRAAAEALALGNLPTDARLEDRLAAVERLLLAGPPHFGPYVIPAVIAGIGSWAAAGALLGDLASAGERQTVLRGLPYNPTTEMDLALWALAQRLRADAAAARAVRETAPERLARDYLEGRLPPLLQAGLAGFLNRYGHRGVAEIDLGLPRWGEDPAYVLGALARYLEIEDDALAPDAHFRRAQDEAGAMIAGLVRRAGAKSRLQGWVVRLLLDRARALAGLREAPKFYAVAILARVRALLQPVGEALAGAGRLEAPADVDVLTLPEARAALAGADLRPVVRERRASYERERRRRHVPRILLSDGTEPGTASGAVPATDGVLRGTPASAGIVTARARVILEPHGARLEPGEILVAPSTDPGWTPLFLTAAGLVMEMGGPMSHGAVVAREYGIPAVVGVPGATERIATGQEITLDGSTGTVTLHRLQSGVPATPAETG